MTLRTSISIIVVLLLITAGCRSSQQAAPKLQPTSKEIKVTTQTKAAIVGGMKALYQQLSYPKKAKQNNIETTLKANVLVNKKGKIKQITFDGQPRSDFQQAARKALRSITFRAGQRNSQPVDMYITIPIAFRL